MHCPKCCAELKPVGYQTYFCQACKKVWFIEVQMTGLRGSPEPVSAERE